MQISTHHCLQKYHGTFREMENFGSKRMKRDRHQSSSQFSGKTISSDDETSFKVSNFAAMDHQSSLNILICSRRRKPCNHFFHWGNSLYFFFRFRYQKQRIFVAGGYSHEKCFLAPYFCFSPHFLLPFS